jgi:hypothetical protein
MQRALEAAAPHMPATPATAAITKAGTQDRKLSDLIRGLVARLRKRRKGQRMSERTITTADELKALNRGDVIISSHWADAFSYAGDEGSPMRLLNVATGHYTSPAELGSFFPAEVIYEFEWASND